MHHPIALRGDVDAEHHRIGGQRPGPDAEHRPAHRHMIELDDAIGDHQRIMKGKRDDARAEADAPGQLRRGGDHQLGRADRLPAGRVMLAEPGFAEAELVHIPPRGKLGEN